MKRFIHLRTVWLLPALVLLAACSGIPLKERQMAQRDRYHKYAGSPVNSFRSIGGFDGWTPIDKYELVLWTGVNDAYLITVEPPCEDLLFTDRIGLTQMSGTVYQKFDSVLVDHWKCRIESIQPVDYPRMKKERQQEAEASGQAAEE